MMAFDDDDDAVALAVTLVVHADFTCAKCGRVERKMFSTPNSTASVTRPETWSYLGLSSGPSVICGECSAVLEEWMTPKS